MSGRKVKRMGSWLIAAFVLLVIFSSTARDAVGYVIGVGLSGVSLAARGLRAVGGDAAVALMGAIVVSVPIVVAALISAKRLHRGDRRAGRLEKGLCPGCGYSLEGLPTPRCPECGYENVSAE